MIFIFARKLTSTPCRRQTRALNLSKFIEPKKIAIFLFGGRSKIVWLMNAKMIDDFQQNKNNNAGTYFIFRCLTR